MAAIDGKTVRHPNNGVRGKRAIYLVSACTLRNRVTLGQVKVE